MLSQGGRKVRAAYLFLALEDKFDVQWQRALLLEKRLRHLENDEHRTLVVAGPAAADHVTVNGEFERRGLPLGQVTGRLHIVMAVHQNGRSAWCVQPVTAH